MYNGRKRGLKKRWIFGPLSLVLLAGGFFTAWHVISAPAHGTVSPIAETKPVAADADDAQPAKVDAKLASFLYPAGYHPVTTKKAAEPEVYSYMKAGGLSGSGSQLTVTLYAAGGNIADSSAYRFRQLHPDIYKAQNYNAQDVSVPGFSAVATDTGSEYVAFWQHGSASASIIVVGSDAKLGKATFQQLLDSWQWAQ